MNTLKKVPVDTNPYVRIEVKNSKEVLFYSSDPLEIQKHNLNGLGIDSYIDINNKEYIVKDLSTSLFSSPMDFKHGVDFNAGKFKGREIPFICDIKITVKD